MVTEQRHCSKTVNIALKFLQTCIEYTKFGLKFWAPQVRNGIMCMKITKKDTGNNR